MPTDPLGRGFARSKALAGGYMTELHTRHLWTWVRESNTDATWERQ